MKANRILLAVTMALVLLSVAVDASRVSNRLGLMRKAGVTEYVVRTSDGQEHVVMLEDPPAPTNTVEGTPTTTTTTATPAPAPAPAAAPATNTAPASTNNNNNNGGGGGGTSVNVQQAKVPTGGELFMMYLPFIILLLVLLITCALCYLFRDRLPTCVHYIEVCCEYFVKAVIWPFRMLWRCFKWCWYPLKECCIDCVSSCCDIFYPSRIKI